MEYGTNMKYNFICNSSETAINCLLNDQCVCIEDRVVIDHRDFGDVNKKKLSVYKDEKHTLLNIKYRRPKNMKLFYDSN